MGNEEKEKNQSGSARYARYLVIPNGGVRGRGRDTGQGWSGKNGLL